jgi:MFS superfamily sulfate permease-like transporter
MVDGAGGRSQLASLTCAGVVLVVLLFLTRPLQYMPEAVLSTVVFLIGIELIAINSMKQIYRLRPDEFIVASITAVVVVVVGVEQGILLAIVLSILDHLRFSYKPNDAVLVRDADGAWKERPLEEAAQAVPGLAVYRFGANLYYANANRFADQVRTLSLGGAGDAPRWICVDAEAIDDIDYSAAQTLRETHDQLAARGVRLVLAEVTARVQAEIDKFGLTEAFGDGIYEDLPAAVAAFQAAGQAPAPG